MSFQHSSRILAPIMHWLFPNAPEETIHAIVLTVRKCAHVSEYAVLALLAWRAFKSPGRQVLAPWSWPMASWVLLFVFLYAASDEFHQRFVPSREASFTDVLLDSSGGVFALIFLWIIGRWRRRTLEQRRNVLESASLRKAEP